MDSATPLKGLTVLDVGCGGGILSEVFFTSHFVTTKFVFRQNLQLFFYMLLLDCILLIFNLIVYVGNLLVE